MIKPLTQFAILVLLSKCLLMTSIAVSAPSEASIGALYRAKTLEAAAAREGASWTIALQHLKNAETLMSDGDYESSFEHANRAIYFFELGLKQKKLPLYIHH